MLHGRPQKLSREGASLKAPPPPLYIEKKQHGEKKAPQMEIYFYDFLGTGRAPTLAHPIAGVHSMLPPQKKQKKTTIMVV